MKKLILICLLSLILLGLGANTSIRDIRFGYYDFGARIVIETDATTDYSYDVVNSELKLRINSKSSQAISEIKPKTKFIDAFQVSGDDSETYITVGTRFLRRPSIFTLSGKPFKIVIDLLCEPSKNAYTNDLGIAKYLMNLGMRKQAGDEFEKIEQNYPDKKDFYFYYAMNDLKLSNKDDAINHFKMVESDDRNYPEVVNNLKKLGVNIPEKTERVADVPVPEVKEVEETLAMDVPVEIQKERVNQLEDISDSTSVIDPSFFKSPFWYLTLVLFIIVAGSTIFFFIRKSAFKSKFDESDIKFNSAHDLQSKQDAIRKLYNQGWSVKAISKELNVDQEDVYLTIEDDQKV